jgi:hypothetical protein
MPPSNQKTSFKASKNLSPTTELPILSPRASTIGRLSVLCPGGEGRKVVQGIKSCRRRLRHPEKLTFVGLRTVRLMGVATGARTAGRMRYCCSAATTKARIP